MLVKIKYKSYSDIWDEVYINIEYISSIEYKNDVYFIVMNNGIHYQTDKYAFDKVMLLMKTEQDLNNVLYRQFTCSCGNEMMFRRRDGHTKVIQFCDNCGNTVEAVL